jgi:toxin ParE1/3/4
MSNQIQQTLQAEADITEIVSFIAEGNQDAARRFLDATEAAFALLASMPLIGRVVLFQSKATQDIRMGRIQGFERYLIFYRSGRESVEVVRVLHEARDIERLFHE